MPAPVALPNDSLRLPTTNSRGSERPGGLRVRMDMSGPLQRYEVQSAELFVGQTPTYRAVGDEPFLHLDMETTSPRLYNGQELPEVHFGVQATYKIDQVSGGTYNYAVVSMTPENLRYHLRRHTSPLTLWPVDIHDGQQMRQIRTLRPVALALVRAASESLRDIRRWTVQSYSLPRAS